MLRVLVKEIGSAGPASGATPVEPEPVGLSVQALLQRAIARPERLRTPARRRVAFLQHYAACRTLLEAAARAGIDRRTVNRWRQASPAFDRRLNRVVADRREDDFELALLVAGRPNIRPIFYKGEKVGEYEIPNTALALYLMKQADAEERRAEDRRSLAAKTAEAAPSTMGFTESIEQGLRRVAKLRHRFAEEDAERRRQEAQDVAEQRIQEKSRSPRQRKMSRSPGHREMSHPPGHSEGPAAEQDERDGDSMSHPPGHAEMSPSELPRAPRPGGLPHCPDPARPSTWWVPRSLSYVEGGTPTILD